MSELPNFDGKTPKEMRRAWAVFMADQDWEIGSEWHAKAEFVRLAIETLILNQNPTRDDDHSEYWARHSLRQQLAAFEAVWP